MAAKTNPTILIAGGAGFLGSHLCDRYIQTHRVVCIDNLSSGRMENINRLKDNPDFEYIQADVSQALPDSISKTKFDIVVNFASPASPPHYQKHPLETLQAGSAGTLNLLNLASRHNARFMHASTSEIYGDPEVHPQPESYKGSVNCYGPRSMYDEAKRFAEALIYSYRREHKLDTVIARFFNTYGPRMRADDGRVVSNFIVQALNKKPLTIYGDGSQTRSFCYVDDLIDGVVQLIGSAEEGPLNLGNPHEFTVKELGELVLGLTGSESKFEFRDLPEDDPLQRQPVIELARKKLGWQPKTELRGGLQRTIDYFIAQKATPS